MGNKPSWRERRACATTPASRYTLSERDAWDVATAWHAQLRGFVRLDANEHVDVDDPAVLPHTAKDHTADDLRIVERLEWIEFDFAAGSKEFEEKVGAARAATIAWFALSCCPGFSGEENPVFWKRVLSVLMRPLATATTDDGTFYGAVTDRERFFDHPERPFPRIRFTWCERLPLELLWEVPWDKKQQRYHRKIDRILQQLQPFILRSRWRRPIPVSIRVENETTVPVEMLQHVKHRDSEQDLPVFQLTTIVGLWSVVRDLVAKVSTSVEVRGHVGAAGRQLPWIREPIHEAMDSLLALQNGRVEPMAHVCIPQLSLWWYERHASHHAAADAELRACCSALPHTRRITGLKYVDEEMNVQRSKWLGYAIFHPDTAAYHSSIASLTLWLSDGHAIQALEGMSIGNNLASDEETVLTGYYQARVRAATAVLAGIPMGVGQPSVLYTFSTECWITLCGAADDTESSIDRWLQIVLPGHGFGWIQSTHILEIVHQAAAPSSVRRLRVHVKYNSHIEKGDLSEDTKSSLFKALAVLGDRLTYLHVDTISSLTAPTMVSILRMCPNLEALCVRHDGSCWSDPQYLPLIPQHPRLLELELFIGYTLQPLASPQLNRLRVLRVRCTFSRQFLNESHPAQQHTNRHTVQSILSRYPSVEYFNWHVGGVGMEYHLDHGTSYDDYYLSTRQLLDPSSTGWYDMAQVPFLLPVRLAFLSVVVHQYTSSRAIARLSRDAMRLIFSFTTSSKVRHLHIDM